MTYGSYTRENLLHVGVSGMQLYMKNAEDNPKGQKSRYSWITLSQTKVIGR